ncbi:hypothetical protein GS640_10440 [Rhodococcus hoagii]|nr:hypothetical protein [Prescottella equi]
MASVAAGVFCIAAVGSAHLLIDDDPRTAAAATLAAAVTVGVPAFLLAAKANDRIPEVHNAKALLAG